MPLNGHISGLLALGVAMVLGACAAEVRRDPVALSGVPAPRGAEVRVLAHPVSIVLETAYIRTLPAASRFVSAGQVPQGAVWRPLSLALTVEGAHVHEAWPVTSGGQLVGFYLPVERAYSPLPSPVPARLNPTGEKL